MTRFFVVEWHKINEYKPVVRHTRIEVPNASEDIGIAAAAASHSFGSIFGGLNKINIIKIQEISKEGEDIGFPIVPDNESSIVPTKK